MIDTHALRSKILALAMCGKLTEQLPEDGTAEELYQKIQTEKQAFINAGKIAKEKQLPEVVNEEIPFAIPDNWKWARIGSIFTLKSGKNISASNISHAKDDNHNIPCIGGNGQRGFVNQANVDGFHAIIGRQGALCGNINFVEGPFYATEHAVVVYAYAETNMIWAGVTLRFLNLNQYATSVAQPGLAVSKINKVLIPLPPLAEQQRIVERIGRVFSILDDIDILQSQYDDNFNALKDKLIDAALRGKLTEQLPEDGTAEELYRQIQEEKQTLIQEGIIKQEKQLPQIKGNEIPYEVPNNWMWLRWGDLAFQIQYGYNAPAVEKGRIKMVRISDIQNNKVVWNTVPYCDIDEESISEYRLYPNNILFARTGGTVGKSFLVETVEEEAVFAGYLIRTSFSSSINAQYMKYFMESQLYWKQLQNGTTATAQPNCNAKTLSKMIVPLPPLAEQQRIVKMLNEVLSLK